MEDRDREELETFVAQTGVDPSLLQGADGIGSRGRVAMIAALAAENQRSKRP